MNILVLVRTGKKKAGGEGKVLKKQHFLCFSASDSYGNGVKRAGWPACSEKLEVVFQRGDVILQSGEESCLTSRR